MLSDKQAEQTLSAAQLTLHSHSGCLVSAEQCQKNTIFKVKLLYSVFLLGPFVLERRRPLWIIWLLVKTS